MAEGILAISLAGSIRFAKYETDPPDGASWENTLVCQESNPDGKHYGYAQRLVIGDIIKVYWKSAYTTHVVKVYDEADVEVEELTVTEETTYATYSFFSVTLNTTAYSADKSYYLTLVATRNLRRTELYK